MPAPSQRLSISGILQLCWVLALLPLPAPHAAEMASVDNLSHIQSGSLVFRKTDGSGWQLVPGLKTRVNLTINGLLLRASVEQEFHNDSKHWLNTSYVFPLPHQAAIDKLQIQIGKRLIQGQIQPRGRAKSIYQQAKQQGKKAALLQQHKADVFSTDIANIAPGERIKVQIEYQELLTYQAGQISLRLPLLAVPRYKPKNLSMTRKENQTTADSFSAPSVYVAELQTNTNAHEVDIHIELDTGLPAYGLQSNSHPLDIQSLDTRRHHISLTQPAVADRDFNFSWRVQAAAQPQATEFVEFFQQQQYGMLMLFPPQLEPQNAVLPRQVILAIDTSGSMAGESIRQAKHALRASLQTLSDRDSFNLIEFNSRPRSIFARPRNASPDNKSQAQTWIQQLEAGGGTEMAAALTLAFSQPTQKDNEVSQVIFITDGSVDNEEHLFQLIQQNRKHQRLYTVGIGSAPNSLFMQYAAQHGKGTFTYIASAKEAGKKMQALFKQIQRPVLTDIAASFTTGAEFYPKQIPDLFTDQPLLIFYKSPVAMQDIQLIGQQSGNIWQQSLQLGTGKEQAGLHKLWAKAKIRALTLSHRDYAQQNFVQQQITHTALKHQIISKYTSLVAVDDQLSKPETFLTIDSKVQLPASKGYGRLPQTATSAELKIKLGLGILALCVLILMLRRHINV